MQQFLNSIWGLVAGFAAGVGVLWGLTKAVGALRKWAVVKWDAHTARRDAPSRTLELVERMKLESEAADQRQEQQIKSLAAAQEAQSKSTDEKLAAMKDSLDVTQAQVGTVQQEKLMWAYSHYGIEGHPIPMHTRSSLLEMYEQYTEKAHRNGVPHDFESRINSAPGLPGEAG